MFLCKTVRSSVPVRLTLINSKLNMPELPAEQKTASDLVDTNASIPNTKPKSGWKRFLVYSLAMLGALFVVLASLTAYWVWRDTHGAIKETETIDSTMGDTFGRYSEEHKGWLYVTDDKRSYVMRVVQQANIDDKLAGDGLYFVASGTPLDDNPGTIYAVFYIYKDSKNGALQRAASLSQSDDDLPITPENVRFEALSDQVWAWVIKESTISRGQSPETFVTNVVLAPHEGEIKELARFNARQSWTPAEGCAQAEQEYAKWLKGHEQQRVTGVSESAASAASDVAEKEESEADGEGDEPRRCDDLKWVYKTVGPTKDGVLTPLLITRTGMLNGEVKPAQNWKLMFDSKSFVYLVPDELR